MALGSAVAACGGSGEDSSPSPTSTSGGTPTQGGTLRVGVVGGSTKETLDGQVGTTEPEIACYFQLYDALMGFDQDYQLVNLIAEEVTPNADASKWTVRVRQDAVFHDGRSVSADDVIFSYKRIIDPKAPKAGAATLSDLPASGIRKVDARTVEFNLSSPNAVFSEAIADYLNTILPVGYDPSKPIGTGPFKLTDFRPGEQITFARNPDYFGQVPAVDDLIIIEFADAAARVNALLGDTVDAISQVPSAQVGVIDGSGTAKVLDAQTGAWQPITMRIDQKPFDDVRVRQAFRLMADREAMIAQAYAGFGAVANDMYAPFDPGYPKDLPQRAQDLEQAKSLLKQAGYDGNLVVTLTTSDDIGSGAVAAAQVFAEQAKGAGVNVKVDKVGSGVFYGDNYLKWTFAQDFWYTRNYLLQTGRGSQPTAPWNETHWKNDQWLALVKEATRTADDTKRNDLVAQAMQIEYEQGGYLIWSFNDQIDAYSTKLGGVIPDKFGAPLSSWHLNRFYFV